MKSGRITMAQLTTFPNSVQEIFQQEQPNIHLDVRNWLQEKDVSSSKLQIDEINKETRTGD